MTTDHHALHTTLDQEVIARHLAAAHLRSTPSALWTAIADIPVMLAEMRRLALSLAWTRTELASLLAAARATLAADRDGEADPLEYLRDEVSRHDPVEDPR